MPVCKTRVGYLSWLAPKVLSGRGYTTACDIWAVASNVIEHADGKPFLYALPESIVRQHISYSTPPPRPPFSTYGRFTSGMFVYAACVRSVQELFKTDTLVARTQAASRNHAREVVPFSQYNYLSP